MKISIKVSLWFFFGAITLAGSGYLSYALVDGNQRLYLPGKTTGGHHQIEVACKACHEPFGGVRQEACVECHGEDLRGGEDSHPKRLFTDPRNADQIAIVDGRLCVSCHVEHKPDATALMGVTVKADFCFACHADIEKERPSHVGQSATGCAAAGCHNYHDNRAMYEEFLVKHAGGLATDAVRAVPLRNLGEFLRKPAQPANLTAADQDAPPAFGLPVAIDEWAASRHAAGGVNCTGCHQSQDGKKTSEWQSTVAREVCAECHSEENGGWLAGKHGMRSAQKLSPMTPAQAYLPMKEKVHEHELGCQSCHADHNYNTVNAAVESCLGCHNDKHSLAFEDSSHGALWRKETTGDGAKGSGVSCATCHLPRTTIRQSGRDRTSVEHNQNANLRPNEKAVRDVCLRCHTLQESLDALSDPALIKRNFSGQSSGRVESIDWAMRRVTSTTTKPKTEN